MKNKFEPGDLVYHDGYNELAIVEKSGIRLVGYRTKGVRHHDKNNTLYTYYLTKNLTLISKKEFA